MMLLRSILPLSLAAFAWNPLPNKLQRNRPQHRKRTNRCFKPYSTRFSSQHETSDFGSRRSDENYDRRDFFVSTTFAAWSMLLIPSKSEARGLVQFPINDQKKLLNSYHFLRVGETLLEEEDIWSTNPLFLTNREAALSPVGAQQMQDASLFMEKVQRPPSVIKYSLAASCIDAANIVGDMTDLGRDKLVPEFTYLDGRGIGRWDMLSYSQTKPAIWALDAMEAGSDGKSGRPPPNEDGTPNETLADQAVRLRQVMSILETLYSGDTILLIFPDGTGPALLSCMIAGIPLNRVHELEFEAGELRMDVTKANILELLKQRERSDKESYDGIIEKGKKELARLRSSKDIVSLKDQKIEAELAEIDKQYKEKEAMRLSNEKEARENRLNRQRELDDTVQENILDSNEKAGSPIPLEAIGAAAVVTTAGVFAAPGTDEKEKKLFVTSKISSPDDKPFSKVDNRSESLWNQYETNGDIEAFSAERNSLTEPVSLKDPVVLDPYEAAAKAMEEYMNQDDGGNDWLNSLSEMMDEDSEMDDIDSDDDSDSTTNKDFE